MVASREYRLKGFLFVPRFSICTRWTQWQIWTEIQAVSVCLICYVDKDRRHQNQNVITPWMLNVQVALIVVFITIILLKNTLFCIVFFPLSFMPHIPFFTSTYPSPPTMTTLLSMSMSSLSFLLNPFTANTPLQDLSACSLRVCLCSAY